MFPAGINAILIDSSRQQETAGMLLSGNIGRGNSAADALGRGQKLAAWPFWL